MRGQKRPTAIKAQAVGIAVVDGASAASRATGVPRPTIVGWMNDPQFDELRQRKQEVVEAEWDVGIQLGFRRAVELLAKTDDPVKAATTAAIMYDKLALRRGNVTSRTETVGSGLPSEVQRALRERFIDITRDRADSLASGVEGERLPEGSVPTEG